MRRAIGLRRLLSFVLAALLPGDPVPSRGIEAGDLDRGAQPCTDFPIRQRTWRAGHPIPDSMTRWSRRWEAGDGQGAAPDDPDEVSATRSWAPGSVEQLIGDFYGSCIDEARRRPGISPVQPLVAEIDAMRTAADVPRLIARFHERGINVLTTSSPDNHQPTQDRRRVRVGPGSSRPHYSEDRAPLPGGARDTAPTSPPCSARGTAPPGRRDGSRWRRPGRGVAR